MRRLVAALLWAGALICGAAGPSRAQDAAFPTRPIRVIVPYPAGGLVDLVTHVVTDRMAQKLGQQFIVESRAGANGTIATAYVAHADADGYTLLMITDSHGVNPLFYKDLGYDSIKDFAPIGLIGKSPLALTVHVSVPARTVAELIALARASPGTLTYGSIGVGIGQAASITVATSRATSSRKRGAITSTPVGRPSVTPVGTATPGTPISANAVSVAWTR